MIVWIICAFVVGAICGALAMFIWFAETIGPALERERRRFAYDMRRDNFARFFDL